MAEPLRLLEESLREGARLPDHFVEEFRREIKAGNLEMLMARLNGRIVGVAILAYHLSISLGGRFASIEDLYVSPESRRRGLGRALLEAARERCAVRSISYLEAQVEDDGAASFYRALGFETEVDVRVWHKAYAL